MFNIEAEYNAAEVVTEEHLEFVSGGVIVDATGNMKTCPPPFVNYPPPHNPNAPIWK